MAKAFDTAWRILKYGEGGEPETLEEQRFRNSPELYDIETAQYGGQPAEDALSRKRGGLYEPNPDGTYNRPSRTPWTDSRHGPPALSMVDQAAVERNKNLSPVDYGFNQDAQRRLEEYGRRMAAMEDWNSQQSMNVGRGWFEGATERDMQGPWPEGSLQAQGQQQAYQAQQ